MKRLAALLALAIAPLAHAEDINPPTLSLGEKAPDWTLKGVDDKDYALKDFDKSKFLVIVFTCNHCPTANAYEGRLKTLVDDYKDKSVALVAISPNDENSVRLDELGYSDLGDSFDEMKIRAKHAKFNYPYLFEGDKTGLVPQIWPDGDSSRVPVRLREEAPLRRPDRRQRTGRRTSRPTTSAMPWTTSSPAAR